MICLLFVWMLITELSRTAEDQSYLVQVIPSINAQDENIEAKLYEACPGTEVALNHPVQYYRNEMGSLGVYIRKKVWVCEDDGWCCPMEWA